MSDQHRSDGLSRRGFLAVGGAAAAASALPVGAAEEAETGFTANLFGQNDLPWVCNYWWGPPPAPHAGFWANIGCVEL